MFKLAVILAAIALCGANRYPSYERPAYKADSYEAPAAYAFRWAVKDEPSYVDMGHTETRNGDRTDGSYHVALPDGRIQTVKYYVDGYSGTIAEVSYSGEPRYDAYKPAPAYQQQAAYRPARYPARPRY